MPATTIAFKKRNGRSYIAAIDWDRGTLLTSVDRYEAMTFPTADAARDWAKEFGLPVADWKMVKVAF